jgi:riboflavin transporter
MKNKNVTYLVQSSVLLASAIVFQIVGSRIPGINQLLVGSVINAVLLVAAYLCGTFYGAAIGVLTPWTALLVGQLKPAMAPFIPFIMIGNALFVICFGLLASKMQKGKYAGIALGAVLKFSFLYFSATKLIYLFKMNLPANIAKALATAMGSTQLVTALIGGALALALIETLVKRVKLEPKTRSAS